MEITGKIIWAGERRSGVGASSGQQWASQDFVVQNISTDYSGRQVTTNICFSVNGVERLNEYNLCVGDECTVHYGMNAHEYHGKWYNDVRAWKVEKSFVQQAAQQYAQQGQQQQGVQPTMFGQQYQQQYGQQAMGQPQQQYTQQAQPQQQYAAQPQQAPQQQNFPPAVDASNGLPF